MLPATVFVIDDDPAVRDSISALVTLRGVAVQAFASGEEFLDVFAGDVPGCVVADLRIERGMSGLELQRELTEAGHRIPVIVLSAYANVGTAVEVMHRGAVTLLEKSCTSEQLWEAIRDAIQRDAVLREKRGRIETLRQRFRELTPDEVQVLVRIVAGMLNKVIAKDLGTSLRTVESRRSNVLRKAGVETIPELVRMCVELEYGLGQPLSEVLIPESQSAQDAGDLCMQSIGQSQSAACTISPID